MLIFIMEGGKKYKVFVDISTSESYNGLVDKSTRSDAMEIYRFKLFTSLMSKINKSIRKIKAMEMAEFNLKSTHVSCLYYLYEEDKAAISRTLDYLESNGYLTCDAKCKKRYKSPLKLTNKGKMVALKIREKICKVLDAVGMVISEENRIIFYESLKLISSNLEKIAE